MSYKVDFKKLAEDIDIEAVASLCGLMLKRSNKELRAACPSCNSSDERTLAVMPETNSFRCYAANLSGDCIALYAHLKGYQGMYRAAKELNEHFLLTVAPPAPKPEKQESKGFDARAFAERLTYSEEVEKLGITKETAARFGIGFCPSGSMKGFVCFPVIADEDTHYIGWNGTEFKMPKWQTNIVTFKRRA